MPREFESKTYDNIFSDIKTAIESNQANLPQSKKLSDFSEGSIIYTIIRSIAATISNYWSFIKELTDGFYVSTATGAKLFRRLQDFNYTVKTGSFSTGTVYIVKPAESTSTITTVPLNTELISSDGSAAFNIESYVDPTKTGFSSNNASAQAIQVIVRAKQMGPVTLAPGVALFSRNYTGLTFKVGTQSNTTFTEFSGTGITGGTASETDQEARVGFRSYIQNLGYGTVPIIENAVKSITGVQDATVHDNKLLLQNNTMVTQPGSIVVDVKPTSYVNGNISQDLKNKITDEINRKRPAGLRFFIRTPELVKLDCVVYVKSTVQDPVQLAAYATSAKTKLNTFFSSLSPGKSVYLSVLENSIFDASISNISLKIVMTYSADNNSNVAGQEAGNNENREVLPPLTSILVLKNTPTVFINNAEVS